ncbi:MAG: T9SS type A sorting domain-containing protein [bacterium]
MNLNKSFLTECLLKRTHSSVLIRFLMALSVACSQSVFAQLPTQVFIPNVPDENQPPKSNQSNWCTPTAALNITRYWDDVICEPGANGVMNGWAANVASDTIGWFMDTNDLGSTSRANTGVKGTINQDIQPGLTEFVRWDRDHQFGNPSLPPVGKMGYDWIVQTVYTNGFDFQAAEIDSGRPVLITFLYWNPVYANQTEIDPTTGATIHIYTWGQPVQQSPTPDNSEAPQEDWNEETGTGGIGHAVTGVGYWRNFKPAGKTDSLWVIVHDNWANTTHTNMAIPWQHWTSVTKAKPQSFIADAPFAVQPTINGAIAAGEYTDADSAQVIQNKDTTRVYYKVDGTYLYVAFNMTDLSASSSARIYLDTAHDGGSTPQTDDYRLTRAINGQMQEDQGSGAGWSANSPSGWISASSVGAKNWQAEFRIAYTKLGVAPGSSDTLGISFWDANTGAGDDRWPTGAEDTVPCTWGDLVSSDLFVPVELTSFRAQVMNENRVMLLWSTATETHNYGFEVQRKTSATEFRKVAFVKGAGTTTSPQHYTFVDKHLASGVYFYRLKQLDFDGAFRYSQVIRTNLKAPAALVLFQNFPNPFNASTRIHFELAETAGVTVKILNTRGQEIRALTHAQLGAGKHFVIWDGLTDQNSQAASGLYFYKIETEHFVTTRKMILIR